MTLRVVVCLKAALDPVQEFQVASSPPRIQPERPDPVYTLGPADGAALEAALRLKEMYGVEVTVLSLGGPPGESVLAAAIAAGVDHSIHLRCADSAVPDAWTAVEIVVAELSRREYNLVLCGDASLDDGSGVFGPFLAETLGWAHISHAVWLEYDPQTQALAALRALEHGDRQRVLCMSPAVVSISPLSSRLRYISILRLKKANRSLIERIDLPISPPESELRVIEISQARLRPRRMAAPGAGLSAAQRMQLMMGRGESGRPASKEKLFEGTAEAAVERIIQYLQENGLM